MTEILVAYFSTRGNTEKVAKVIAEETGADMFEIKAKNPYTNADLNWMDKNSRSTIEMQDLSFRPEIAELLPNIDKYKTIYIGFPIWWYIAPTIINTFIESYDFSDKIIIPFFTSGGSGAGETDAKLHISSPSSAWLPAKRLYPNDSEYTKNWLKGF